MKDKSGKFPFGTIAQKVEQQDRSPKKVFLLGSFAESVYADWIDPEGNIIMKGLPVASEPYPFWDGEDASDIVQSIQVPTVYGKLIPSCGNINGLAGKKLDEYILEPLDYQRSELWFCYLQPYSRINPGKLKVLKSAYAPLVESGHAAMFDIPLFNPSDFHDKSRIGSILEELEYSQADTIILIGEIAIKHFIAQFSGYKTLADFGESILSYGKYRKIQIGGKTYKVMALIDPLKYHEKNPERHYLSEPHMYWFLEKYLMITHRILKGSDPINVSKKPVNCPICYCRKILTISDVKPPFTSKIKRGIREGRIKIVDTLMHDDPKYICTECKFEFYEKVQQ